MSLTKKALHKILTAALPDTDNDSPMHRLDAATDALAHAQAQLLEAERAVSIAAAARDRLNALIADVTSAAQKQTEAEAAAAAAGRQWAEAGATAQDDSPAYAAASKARDDAYHAQLRATGASSALPQREADLAQALRDRDTAKMAVREARGSVLLAQASEDLDELTTIAVTYRKKLKSLAALAVIFDAHWGEAHPNRRHLSPPPAAKDYIERVASLSVEIPSNASLYEDINEWLKFASTLAERPVDVEA